MKFKGFTLVELIVVIAILGVLCGVLVPNGLAWIRDSKLKTCNSEAKTVYNTAVTVFQDYQLEGKISNITSVSNGSYDYFSKNDADAKHQIASNKITKKLGANFPANSVWSVQVQVFNPGDKNSNLIKVLSTVYADSDSAIYVGRYPLPANQRCSSGYNATLSTNTNGMFNIDDTVSDPLYTP